MVLGSEGLLLVHKPFDVTNVIMKYRSLGGNSQCLIILGRTLQSRVYSWFVIDPLIESYRYSPDNCTIVKRRVKLFRCTEGSLYVFS